MVTDASREIDRQITLTLSRGGTSIIIDYNGSAAKTEEVVKEIEAAGSKVEAVQCNVSNFGSCGKMMVDVVSRYGHLGILANNAGIVRDNLSMEVPEEDFDIVINTNLKDVFNRIKHISRQMSRREAGRIIDISSISEILGNMGQASHCVVKVGVIGATRSAAKGLTNKGITINAMAPDFIVAEMTDVPSDSIGVATTEQIPMKHFRSARDIAETVALLVSDKAGYITSQVLGVDGGMAIQDNLEYFPS